VSRLAFSLIEILLVLIIISFVAFLVITLPSFKKVYTFENLRELVYPDGIFILDKDKAYVIKNGKKKEINFRYSKFEVYDIFLNKKTFKNHLFIYKMKNKIGDSLIIKESKIYFYKPFFIRKFNSLDELRGYVLKLNEGLK
jgi:hypothetical protein